MRSFTRVCLLLFAGASLMVGQVSRAAEAPANPLLEMLALIPDNADAHPTNGFSVSYADYQALVQAGGITDPMTSTAFAALDTESQRAYFRAFQRLSAGMPISNLKLYVQGMQKLTGIDWFSVERAIYYGTPPRTVTILGGKFDTNAIAQALKPRDFESTDVDGVTVWSRFEDNKLNLKAVEKSDPFGGELGAAARIVLLPGYVSNSRTWDLAKATVAAFKQQTPSLAQSEDYRVLAQAITDPAKYSGALIQAQFAEPALFDETRIPANSLSATPDLSGSLPDYKLAVLADRQEGDNQINLIAVVYPDAVTAQKAATELYKRIAGFDLRGMYAKWNVTIDQPTVYKDGKGRAVAVVSVRYPSPKLSVPATEAATAEPPVAPGNVFRTWINAISRREFYPLASNVPKP